MMKARAELQPIGEIHVQLGERIKVGSGPKGTRWIFDVISVEIIGKRINANLAIGDAADWLTLSNDGSVGSVDVRFTLKTHDDAYIYVEYAGRADMGTGMIAVAPTFQTGDPRYAWLNKIQAVGAGILRPSGQLVYSLYEVVISCASPPDPASEQ